MRMNEFPHDVNNLLKEIETTRFSPIRNTGCKKIYKMVLLLAMLECKGRNASNWWKPIKPEEAAPFFHFILTHWDVIREVQFLDQDKRDFKIQFDEPSRRYTERLIAEMPMGHWGKNHQFGHYDRESNQFFFRIDIDPAFQLEVFKKVKEIAIRRIQEAMPILDLPVDFYDFNLDREITKVEEIMVPVKATEREMLVKGRIGQGKFRTHLLRDYDHCVLCRISSKKLLVASHIKRWADSTHDERMDLNNALLLCPLHDKLFDSWTITFDEKGQCLVNRNFQQHADYQLFLRPMHSLISLDSHQNFLEEHRRKFSEAEKSLPGKTASIIVSAQEPSVSYCPFCETSHREIVLQNAHAKAFFDQFPVSPGHLLIVPKRHFDSWFDANPEERASFDALLVEGKLLLEREYHPNGFNIGVNVGTAAGQSVGHMHIHLIPRYQGDMQDPKGGVRGVIPEKQKYDVLPGA
ncbi:HIT domain-containing protein [Myxococcota bacterium]|nr:HIT domain-containing protein [Myxococcota bacterium]MBU1412845.1 HIT domain-containing protein [Myxococcota bacterium]